MVKQKSILAGPEWAKLENFKCSSCSLEKSEYGGYCPVVLNLLDLVGSFQDSISFTEVDLSIQTKERSFFKETSLQIGLSSLMGIYMVTSGCPVMEKLKPMVRYHLPFATTEETMYRMITMYLLAQYFLNRKGISGDWDLIKLNKTFDEIQAVNQNFCAKLRNIVDKDAVLNALVKLNSSVNFMAFRLDMNILDEIEHHFNAYF